MARPSVFFQYPDFGAAIGGGIEAYLQAKERKRQEERNEYLRKLAEFELLTKPGYTTIESGLGTGELEPMGPALRALGSADVRGTPAEVVVRYGGLQPREIAIPLPGEDKERLVFRGTPVVEPKSGIVYDPAAASAQGAASQLIAARITQRPKLTPWQEAGFETKEQWLEYLRQEKAAQQGFRSPEDWQAYLRRQREPQQRPAWWDELSRWVSGGAPYQAVGPMGRPEWRYAFHGGDVAYVLSAPDETEFQKRLYERLYRRLPASERGNLPRSVLQFLGVPLPSSTAGQPAPGQTPPPRVRAEPGPAAGGQPKGGAEQPTLQPGERPPPAEAPTPAEGRQPAGAGKQPLAPTGSFAPGPLSPRDAVALAKGVKFYTLQGGFQKPIRELFVKAAPERLSRSDRVTYDSLLEMGYEPYTALQVVAGARYQQLRRMGLSPGQAAAAVARAYGLVVRPE